jgi:hypothetical protein
LFVVAGLFFCSCVSANRPSLDRSSVEEGSWNTKRVDQTSATAVAPPTNKPSDLVNQPAAAPLVLSQTVTPERLLEFYLRHQNTTSQMGEDDQQLISIVSLPQERRSLGEAVLALSAIKVAMKETGAVAAGQGESDLAGKPVGMPTPISPKKPVASTIASTTSLEKMMQTRQVDFAAAMEVNPFLQTHAVFAMAAAVLDKSADAPQYKEKLRGAIQVQASRWASLAPKPAVGPLVMAPAYMGGYPGMVPPGSTPPGTPTGLPTPQPVDMSMLGTNPLGDAEILINQNRFKDAVAKIRQVPPGHGQYAQAQDKLKVYSNRAVQELRRKAAKAIQDANSASDSKTRVTYLQQAKTQLESALNDYPEADMLGTVRENLEFISGNLEKLKTP